MGRFTARPRFPLLGLLLSAAAALLVFAAAARGADALSDAAREKRLDAVEQAVTRAAVHCYAIEGSYPPSLEYLEEHYGLAIDGDRYAVHYYCFASNLMPDIDVIPLTGF